MTGAKCESWLVVNGEEIKCQWNDKHLGCHSTYASSPIGKVKWNSYSNEDIEKAEQRGRKERDEAYTVGLLRAAEIANNYPTCGVKSDGGCCEGMRVDIAEAIRKEANG